MKHLIIPDTQVRPGVPTDHLKWIGQYALEKRPERIIHIGDHYDMPSLSHYDKGKLQAEGRRYKDDIVAGNKGFTALDQSSERGTSLYFVGKGVHQGPEMGDKVPAGGDLAVDIISEAGDA